MTVVAVDLREDDVSCQADENLTWVVEESVRPLVAEVTGLVAFVEDVYFCQVEEERELHPF